MLRKRRQEQNAYFYIGTAIFLWSTVASAFKLALRNMDYITVLFYACLTSLSALFLIVLFSGRLMLLLQQTVKTIALSAVFGLISPFAYYLVLLKVFSVLPAQEALILNWTWPLVLSFLSAPLLNQKLNRRSFPALILCFIGVIVIAVKGNFYSFQFTNMKADAAALLSSFIWAIFWILNVWDERDQIVKLFFSFLFGTIYITILCLLLDKFQTPDRFSLYSSIYLGLFEMGVTFLFWLSALTILKDNSKAANFAYLTPFLSLVVISVVLREQIHYSSILGLSLIICGILLQNVRSGRHRQYRE